jgi:hypothetical protein
VVLGHHYFYLQGLTFFLAYSIFSAVLGMLQFGYNTGVINAPEQVVLKENQRFLHPARRKTDIKSTKVLLAGT